MIHLFSWSIFFYSLFSFFSFLHLWLLYLSAVLQHMRGSRGLGVSTQVWRWSFNMLQIRLMWVGGWCWGECRQVKLSTRNTRWSTW
jgi:hypothetical protein